MGGKGRTAELSIQATSPWLQLRFDTAGAGIAHAPSGGQRRRMSEGPGIASAGCSRRTRAARKVENCILKVG